MRFFWPVLLRTAIVFAVFAALQYLIPYYLLAVPGLLAGVFLLQTSDDRPLAIGLIAGSVLFGVFAFIMSRVVVG